MKFWPFRKGTDNNEPQQPVSVLVHEPVSNLDQLVIPVTPEEGFAEAASVDISVVPKLQPNLEDMLVISPEPVALLDNPLLKTPPPILLERPEKLEQLGELYGEAYDLPQEMHLPAKEILLAVAEQQSVEAGAPQEADASLAAQVVEIETDRVVRTALFADLNPVVLPQQTRGMRKPSETPDDESIADALIDYKQQLLLEDSRFMNRSINDLVARYFARSDDEHQAS